MSTAALNVIQVGIGGMGNAWLKAVLEAPNADYAGFVEVNPTIAAEQVQRYGLNPDRVFPSLETALASVQADAVINVTPPQFHRTVSLTAIEAGIPVLSEKPLADTFDAAQEIVARSSATGILHMVAQNRRYMVDTQTLHHALQTPGLGAIGSVAVEFFRGPHFGGFREEMAYPLIIDMSIHHFDLMRFFLNRDPIGVYGRSWNPPWSWYQGDASAAVVLDFGDSVVVTYNASWCSQGRDTSWNADWRFECANGVVTMRDEVVTVHLQGQEPAAIAPAQPVHTGQAYLLQEFIAAVRGERMPVTTCQDNLKSLGIVFDVIRSFETGQPVVSRA
jgi:predicted dehydrogenase